MAEECGSCKSAIGLPMRRALLFTLSAVSALAQEPLKQQIRGIASEARQSVSGLFVAWLNIELRPQSKRAASDAVRLQAAARFDGSVSSRERHAFAGSAASNRTKT